MKTTFTNSGRAAQMLRFLNSSQTMFIGLGGTRPWVMESNPPTPNTQILSIDNPLAFFPVRDIYGAVLHPQGTIPTPEGDFYLKVAVENATQAVAENVNTLFIDLSISHNLLASRGITQYRIAALCVDCITMSAPGMIVMANEMRNYTLDTISYFPPVLVSSGTFHLVRFMKRF